jgi:hypothetical protein
MARKSSLSRQAKLNGYQPPVKPSEPKVVKEPVPVRAAEPVAEVAPQPVEPKPTKPPGQAYHPPKPRAKKARFVREKKEPSPGPKSPALPPRSTKITAKLLTREIVLPPKEPKE